MRIFSQINNCQQRKKKQKQKQTKQKRGAPLLEILSP